MKPVKITKKSLLITLIKDRIGSSNQLFQKILRVRALNKRDQNMSLLLVVYILLKKFSQHFLFFINPFRKEPNQHKEERHSADPIT
jgi:hypothetical protein